MQSASCYIYKGLQTLRVFLRVLEGVKTENLKGVAIRLSSIACLGYLAENRVLVLFCYGV